MVGAYNGFRVLGLREKLFELKPAHQCEDLVEMYSELDKITLPPVKIAVTGDGRVAGGVLEVLKQLNVKRVSASEYLGATFDEAVFAQLLPGDYVKRKDDSNFELMHFFNQPEKYNNAFQPFAKITDVLMASAYWHPKSPVLFTAEEMKQDDFKISVISDITCDIEGSIEITKDSTMPDNACFTYFPETDTFEDGIPANGITVMAIDNLPCEFSKESSMFFSSVLKEFANDIICADFGKTFDELDLPFPIKKALILHNGQLTTDYTYMEKFI